MTTKPGEYVSKFERILKSHCIFPRNFEAEIIEDSKNPVRMIKNRTAESLLGILPLQPKKKERLNEAILDTVAVRRTN